MRDQPSFLRDGGGEDKGLLSRSRDEGEKKDDRKDHHTG